MSLIRSLVLPCALVLAGCQSTPAADALIGRYQAQLPGALMNLSLDPDAHCSLTTAYAGKGAFRQSCQWRREVNLVHVALEPGQPGAETLVFAVVGGMLRPVDWSEARYGKVGPGVFERQ